MKSKKYRGWLVVWNNENQEYDLYTPTELEQPKAFRDIEYSCSTIEEAIEFIDTY